MDSWKNFVQPRDITQPVQTGIGIDSLKFIGLNSVKIPDGMVSIITPINTLAEQNPNKFILDSIPNF